MHLLPDSLARKLGADRPYCAVVPSEAPYPYAMLGAIIPPPFQRPLGTPLPYPYRVVLLHDGGMIEAFGHMTVERATQHAFEWSDCECGTAIVTDRAANVLDTYHDGVSADPF